MIKVSVSKQSNFPINTPKIKECLRKKLEEKGIVSDSNVSIALVNKTTMRELANRYGLDDKDHSVLSFVASDVKEKFISPPDGTIHLGEIVICYPHAVEEAKKEGILIEEKIIDLLSHGTLHLLGVHHN